MMASSMLTSERRWTATRKSGMTVLGKVPKPINLPSQKLENHGLDPNVEIVPKGALTWGNRPMLASSSAWGSSTLSSPRADGSIGSSNHTNGRPLSGGSGTRPSTGSSERSSEPSATSWGPSSRPSSASGIAPTSHVLVAANRPRSAETRLNSSNLSRFADSSADGISWATAGSSEKVVAEASKRNDFTLSSGDFPTLGSEKIDESKLVEGQSLKVPASESGVLSNLKGAPESQLNSGYCNPGPVMHGNFNSWSADNSSHTGEDASSRTENWDKGNLNAQSVLDANMPARQFASWHGPPGHSPNVVWYGGHEAGGPYRPFGPRDSYHVEPYYPYVPTGALPNAQAFSRPEAIPGGVHFNKREAYRHVPPESYSTHNQPRIAVSPGVYPGPVMYEDFRAPPQTGFDSSSEHVSNMGMPGQYNFHNQHLPDNSRLQPWRIHTQPASVMNKQQMISDQANETQGQYKVLLKQHGNQEEEHNVTVWPTSQGGRLPGFSTPEVNLINCYKQEQNSDKQHLADYHSEHSNDIVDHSNRNSLGISRTTGHNVMKKVDATSVPIRDQHNTNFKKNASLMEKVEGLNSKTRVVDVNFEGANFSSKEKMKNNQNSKNNTANFENSGRTDFISASDTPVSDPRNVDESQLNSSTKVIVNEPELKPGHHQSDKLAVVPDKPNHSEDAGHLKSRNQKRIRNMKAGLDHNYGKLKFGSYGTDEMNNTPDRGSFEKISVAAGKSGHLLSILGSHASQKVSADHDSQPIFKPVSEPSLPPVDDDQHAKLKELARQRGIELQKKEAERIAEQKEKALAKLDELNRRTSASSKQNSREGQAPCNDTLNKHDATPVEDVKSSAVANETPHGSLSCDIQAKSTEKDESIGDLVVPSFSEPSRTSGSSFQACPSVDGQSWPLSQESTTTEINTGRTTSDLQDEVVSRRKQVGYRRRRNISDEHYQSERKNNSDSGGNTESASIVIEGSSDGLGNVNNDDSALRPSNKNNRGSKYKVKLCDTHLSSTLPTSAHLEGVSEKNVLDRNETKPLVKLVEQMTEKISDETMGGQDSFDLTVAHNHEGLEPCKVTSERASNNWKPHPHRKPTRNLQSDKANVKYQPSDAVVWAPVKPVNKNGLSEQVHKSSASQVTNLPDGKNGQDLHNGAKARRAEMERYVPKPIAKELSLQGDSQHSPPIAPASFANMTGKQELASATAVTGKDVSVLVAKAMTSMNTDDNKQNRQGKTRASWRQRNNFEHEQSEIEGNLSSESSKCVEKASELQHSGSGDDLHVEAGNGLLEGTMNTTLSVVKNHDMVNRQRRQQYKEHRVDRSSYASTHGKVMPGEIPDKREMQSLVPAEPGERNHSRNDNQSAGSGQMRSHWQPKSHVHPQHYLQGHKDGGEQRAADKHLPSQTIEKNLDDCVYVDQKKKIEVFDAKYQEGYSGRKVMTTDEKHQESTKGRKVMKQPSKAENASIDRDLTVNTEAAYADANSYQEYPGVHRRGYNRGHVARAGDATYGGSQKTHFAGDGRNAEQNIEYQTGFNNKGGGDMFQQNFSTSEVAAESHRVSSGGRYGMHGRSHSRRGGHFHGPRRVPAVRANDRAFDIEG